LIAVILTLLRLGLILGNSSGSHGCAVLLFPNDTELLLNHRWTVQLCSEEKLLKVTLVLLGLDRKFLSRFYHSAKGDIVLCKAFLKEALLFLLILISTTVIFIWVTENFKLFRVSFSVELDFSIALLRNTEISSCDLGHLLIEAIQVGCHAPDPLVILIYEHLAPFQLEDHSHLCLERSFKLFTLLHIHRGFLKDLAMLSRIDFLLNFELLTLSA